MYVGNLEKKFGRVITNMEIDNAVKGDKMNKNQKILLERVEQLLGVLYMPPVVIEGQEIPIPENEMETQLKSFKVTLETGDIADKELAVIENGLIQITVGTVAMIEASKKLNQEDDLEGMGERLIKVVTQEAYNSISQHPRVKQIVKTIIAESKVTPDVGNTTH